MQKLTTFALAAGVAGTLATGAGAAVYDFDTETNYTGNFSQVGSVWNSTAGLGGSGGVVHTAANDRTSHLTAETFDLSTQGATLTLSAFLKLDTNPTGPTIGALGISDDTAAVFQSTPAAGDEWLAASLRRETISSVPSVTLRVAQNNAIVGTSSNNVAATSIVNNNWYKLTVVISRSATANTFIIGGTLEDVGATGTETPTTVLTLPTQDRTVLASTYSDTQVYSGFRIRDSNGTNAIDNFTAIPEPASLALLGLGGLLIASRRRGA